MDEFQHPLFFEARDVTDKEREKIRRHFLKKRDSGGDECGAVKKTGGNIYKISFKEKEDQERVLQRKSHTISLPSGELHLIVSRTDSPVNNDQPSTSQSFQDLSFVNNDVKVYTEGSNAVVLGEVEAVNERITILEKSVPTRKELPIAEKQFKLVEEEFRRHMTAHCPEVKIHRGNATISLEGLDKDVQSGAIKLDELIKKIKEKRVKICTALLTFIKSSNAISKYQQNLRNPVSLEVGSDLVLSSLSPDALDEAEAALQRDLIVANVELQEAAAVPPDLDRVKEIMIKEKDKANWRELRVDVSFIPSPRGTIKVRLVGYSENVNKLKEVLHEYQMNQVGTQEVLKLQLPELVDSFDKVLKLIGMKQTNVTLTASHFPYPSVLVSGPRHLVQETQRELNATLAGLTSDKLVLDGPGAQLYFQAEGKVSKELVESSCHNLMREQQGVNSSNVKSSDTSSVTPTPAPRTFQTTPRSIAVNKTSLEIKLGSLEDEQANVLVVPMHKQQLTSTKIGKSLLTKAGNAFKSKFDSKAATYTLGPRDVLQVDAPSSLGCYKLFFIECLPWDGIRGQSVQTCKQANKKCLEKIFKLDIYLLYYLRDNPKADKILRKQLSCIDCTVEFNLEEEEAVVRGDIKKDSGDAFGSAAENWETEVDRVFIGLTERYLSYHVVDPKSARILLQDLSFVNDDIKVYTEDGYAVVVGQVEAVNKRIAILEKSVLTRKELPIAEKQFKLVEEEFRRHMTAHCPEAKIHRGNATIFLEGLDKDVQSGTIKLDELIKKIKEKRVKICTALLTFIKFSNAISKYQDRFQQNLRNPVSLEVGSDLVLSSLSPDALDEAEAALQQDLIVAHVELQEAAAVPPDLDRVKEIMIKAKNKANWRELRVDVSFIQGPRGTIKVRLVGYSENVNKLKEVLHEYQMNQVRTQEVLNLQLPELVDSFDKVLKLIGMKQTNVTLTASHFPYPCVLVSGPRCLVQETQRELNATLAGLTSDKLVLDGPGAQLYFQAEGKVSKELVESSCHVLIREQQGVNSSNVKSSDTSSVTPTPAPRTFQTTPRIIAVNKTSLEIKLGSLEDEQAIVLVVPMHKQQLTSTKIGKSLLTKAGNAFKSKFDSKAATCTLGPGDVLQVDAPSSLGCSKLFFIECLPWDGIRGQSVQALGNGLRRCLDLCVQQHLWSVAFPVIGPGILLKFPLREAIQVLTECIGQFGLSASSGSLFNIHIAIKPDYPDSEQCYHDVYKQLSMKMNQAGQAIFKSLTSDLDDITMTVGGGVTLQLVFGDISNETTDAVVNTTDFVNFQYDGVCKDILTVAGPEVEAELKAANVSRGEVFLSQPGLFPCAAILHVNGHKDVRVIEQVVCDIIKRCEALALKSVAIPAICAGVGGLDPGVVASAILRGVKIATSTTSLHFLTDIHLVLFKINVFLAFKEEAMQMFSTAVINRVSVPQLLQVQQQQPILSVGALCTTSTSQSVFQFLGLSRKDVDDAMTKLKELYQAQCSTQTFKEEELGSLTSDDMEDLKELVKTQGLYLQMDQSDQGSLTVSGLKDGVNKVMQFINASLHGTLMRKVRVKEEEDLYNHVAWCILKHNGNWERLPKTANHNLENNDVAAGIVDAQGIKWSVDLQTFEAKTQMRLHGLMTKLKRLVNLPDFTLPLYWDNMTDDENLKVVALQPSSPEYRTVKEAFKRTVSKSVMKIERLQNVHLRLAYEVQKKNLSDKNRQEGGAGEKLLYHGTTQDNCDSIMKTGFNRRFAGQNATSFGLGTYFAVNASYSAQPTYSKPAADGTQLMFVARVLTGIYTQGQSDMKVPPPRSGLQSNDRYDSVVDNMMNPNMYVVFHDNQAYPDYLITFK